MKRVPATGDRPVFHKEGGWKSANKGEPHGQDGFLPLKNNLGVSDEPVTLVAPARVACPGFRGPFSTCDRTAR